MVAFNFMPEFASKIETGEKRSTIRSTMRCKIGDTMQLYTNQRTRECRLIMKVTCIGLAKIIISEKRIWEFEGTIGEIFPNKCALHEQEGFKNALTMLDFFKAQYALPFSGYLHVWEQKQ